MSLTPEGWKKWRVKNLERRRKYERERRASFREPPVWPPISHSVQELESNYPRLRDVKVK